MEEGLSPEKGSDSPKATGSESCPYLGGKALLAWLICGRRWGARGAAVPEPGDSSGWRYSLALLGVSFPTGPEDLPQSPALCPLPSLILAFSSSL